MRSSFSVEIALNFVFIGNDGQMVFDLSILSDRSGLGKMVSFVVCFDL